MSSISLYLLSAAVLVLVVVVVGVGLVAGRRRGQQPKLPAPPTRQPLGEAGERLEPPLSPVTELELPAEPEPSTGVVTLERPEARAGRLARLRARLAAGDSTFGRALLALLSRANIDSDTWERVEETLLLADLGVGPTAELMQRLQDEVKVAGRADVAAVQELVRSQLLALVGPELDRTVYTERDPLTGLPAVVMIVGVNGTGKTTTTGKLARYLVAQDEDVLLGAADTFRAAAAEQLQTWGERVGVPVVRGAEGADPASVAFDAVAAGIAGEVDVVLIDTAGRLHTKVGLMDELGKVKRVIEKQVAVTETLLVLDATTGQNGLVQARVFADVVAITGVVLTKLDGTAKGGIVVAVQRELGVPVKLVGVGEGPDDLAPFDPEVFVDALLQDVA